MCKLHRSHDYRNSFMDVIVITVVLDGWLPLRWHSLVSVLEPRTKMNFTQTLQVCLQQVQPVDHHSTATPRSSSAYNFHTMQPLTICMYRFSSITESWPETPGWKSCGFAHPWVSRLPTGNTHAFYSMRWVRGKWRISSHQVWILVAQTGAPGLSPTWLSAKQRSTSRHSCSVAAFSY